METSLGFGHFLAHTDGIARFILALMLIMSVGTWYLIATKGVQAIRSQKKSAEFLAAFWAAPSLDAVARHLRQTGVTEAFSHLVHHGFTAIEQHKAGRETRGAAWSMPARPTNSSPARSSAPSPRTSRASNTARPSSPPSPPPRPSSACSAPSGASTTR
jgi:hypothetical protein